MTLEALGTRRPGRTDPGDPAGADRRHAGLRHVRDLPRMGRNYDSALLATGHFGFAMGSTATAMMSLQAVSERHGHSQLAFLLIPVMGAFLIDLANALDRPGLPAVAMVHLVIRAVGRLGAALRAGGLLAPARTTRSVRDALQKQLDDALGGRVLADEHTQACGEQRRCSERSRAPALLQRGARARTRLRLHPLGRRTAWPRSRTCSAPVRRA